MSKPIKKVVLAYSGGLDTSVIIPWLKENYDNCEVIAVSGDVGQGTELDGLEEKALKTGASKLYIEDLKKEFVEDYIFRLHRQGQRPGAVRAHHQGPGPQYADHRPLADLGDEEPGG